MARLSKVALKPADICFVRRNHWWVKKLELKIYQDLEQMQRFLTFTWYWFFRGGRTVRLLKAFAHFNINSYDRCINTALPKNIKTHYYL